MNLTLSRFGLFVALALVSAACGTPDEESGDVADGETSAMDDGLTAQAVGRLETADPEAAAKALVEGSDPDGCRTRVADALLPNVVHVYLDHCTGRFGRKGHHIVTGEMLVTFSQNADGTLHAEHESVTLTIDERDATRTASADITFDGNLRHIDWQGETHSTTEDGEDFSRVAQHVVDVDRDTQCSLLNGSAEIHKGDREIQLTLSGLTSCENPAGGRFCPTGLIEGDVLSRDVHITKTFDGSASATVEVSGPKGDKTKTIELDCTPSGG
jgi:hypothetical protein